MSSTLSSDFSQLVEQITAPKSEARRFGAIVREARRRRGLTQRELAQRLEVTNGAVAQWERGFARPTMATRVDLAQVLGIPFEQLLPEAADTNGIVVTDPLLVRIVKRLEQLTPEQRQALLTVVLIAASDADRTD